MISLPPACSRNPFEHRSGDGGRIDFVYFSTVVDVQPLDPFRRKLRQETREFFTEAQMRSDDGESFRVEIRHVNGVANGPFEERGANGLCDLEADAFLRLDRGRAEVRSENQVWRFPQW